jgi:hypothetical protein
MEDMITLQQAAHGIVKSLPPEAMRAMVALAREGRLEAVLGAAFMRAKLSHATVEQLAGMIRGELVEGFHNLAGSFGRTGHATETTVVSGVHDVQRITTRRLFAGV